MYPQSESWQKEHRNAILSRQAAIGNTEGSRPRGVLEKALEKPISCIGSLECMQSAAEAGKVSPDCCSLEERRLETLVRQQRSTGKHSRRGSRDLIASNTCSGKALDVSRPGGPTKP